MTRQAGKQLGKRMDRPNGNGRRWWTPTVLIAVVVVVAGACNAAILHVHESSKDRDVSIGRRITEMIAANRREMDQRDHYLTTQFDAIRKHLDKIAELVNK